MALIAPSVGERTLLGYLLNKAAPSDVKYHLYSNNHVPVAADTLGSYTELTQPDYLPIQIPNANWTVATVAGVTTATAVQIQWVFGEAMVAYGYYVTDAASAALLWSEYFSGGPISFADDGGALQMTPKIGLQ